jgi:hypothetical protein
MIFTATQVARSQSTSQEFKAYKAENLAPAVVSDTRIYANPVTTIGATRRQNLMILFVNLIDGHVVL